MQSRTLVQSRTHDPIRLIAHLALGAAIIVTSLTALLIAFGEPSAAAARTTAVIEQDSAPTEGQAHRATSHRRILPVRSIDSVPVPALNVAAFRIKVGPGPIGATDVLSAGPQCPGSGALPIGAAHHSLSAADVDGDGDVDSLHGYVLDGQGYVQVSFTGGGGSVLAVDPGFAPMVAPRPSLGHDLDGDGDEEFTARIAGGIGGFTSALFDVDGCTLRAVTLDGDAAELHTRATIASRSGFMCTHEEGNRFLHVWALELQDEEDLDEPQDGDVYAGPRSMYRLIDGELILQSVSEAYEIPGEYELGQYSTCDALQP